MNDTEEEIMQRLNDGPDFFGKNAKVARDVGVSPSMVTQTKKKFKLN